MNKSKLPILLLVIILIVSYSHNKRDPETKEINFDVDYGGKSKVNIEKIIERKVKSTEYANELGAIKINEGKIIKSKEKVDNKVTIDFFFDPVCPASAAYNKLLQEELREGIDDGTIKIKFRPTPYLNSKTIDDYSNRASSYILAVAEYSPEKTLAFINSILNKDFQPEVPAVNSTPDDKFVKVMEEIGINEEAIFRINENKESFVPTAIAAAEDFVDEDSEWLKFSSRTDEDGNPIVYSPFVLVNQAGEITNKALKINPEGFKQELNEAIKDIIK